jgi:hypothetical protein
VSGPPPITLDAPPLVARAREWAGKRFTLHAENEEVAHLHFSLLCEKATLDVDGPELRIYRTREPGRPWVLDRDGTVVASARKPSVFRDRFLLNLGGEEVELRSRGLLSSVFELRRGDDVLGRLERHGLLGREVELHLPEQWPAALQAFVFFLARILWNRHQAAAAG